MTRSDDASRRSAVSQTPLHELDQERLIDVLERATSSAEIIADVDIDEVARNVDPKKLTTERFLTLMSSLDRLADQGADLDLSRMAPDNFARLVSRASGAQLDGLLGHPQLRARILDEIFRRMRRHYRSEQAASVRAVVHWRFTGGSGEDGYDRYESVLHDGVCTVNTERTADPRATITMDAADFLKLVTSNASAPMLFLKGKLKVNGDFAFAAGLTSLFDLPKA